MYSYIKFVKNINLVQQMIWEEGLFSQIIQLDSGNQIIIFHYNTDFNEIRTVINVWYNNKYLLVYENLLFSRRGVYFHAVH